MRYAILKHKALTDLVDHVNKVLDEGWVLVGGVAVTSEDVNNTPVYFQAVFKPLDAKALAERLARERGHK